MKHKKQPCCSNAILLDLWLFIYFPYAKKSGLTSNNMVNCWFLTAHWSIQPFGAWNKFPKYSPKSCFFMVIYHSRILKISEQRYNIILDAPSSTIAQNSISTRLSLQIAQKISKVTSIAQKIFMLTNQSWDDPPFRVLCSNQTCPSNLNLLLTHCRAIIRSR